MQPRTRYDPSWSVPPTFNFAQDAVDVLAREPQRPALTHVAGDGTVDTCTFADVMRESLRWARLLHERTPEPGQRVVLALDPGLAWAAAILGALRLGLIPVPVGGGRDADELGVRLPQVEPALVVADQRSAAAVARAASRLPTAPQLLELEDARAQLVRVGSPAPPALRPVDTPALVLFTAGRTTGRPRPVVHTHAATFAAYVPARDWLGAEPADRVWCDADGGSATALWHGLFGPWAAGAEVLLVDRELQAGERLDVLLRFPPTIAVQSPEGHAGLLDTLERTGARLEQLRNATSTGSRLSSALRRRFRETTGIVLLDGYTTAETCTVVFQPFGASAAEGSIGVPAPGHVVAPIDLEGYVTPVGMMGDLAVYGRPPSLCAGYWAGAPPSEERAGEWWTLTGDRAAVDQHGSLWLDDVVADEDTPPGLEEPRFAPLDPGLADRPAP